MKVIEKIIQNKYQPKDTNVIWIDESGIIPVIKIHSNGVWKQVELNELTPEQVEAIKEAVKSDISYNDLDEDSLPTINDVSLIGDLTSDDLGLNPEYLQDVTYDELVGLRDNGELIPGMQYRITDYHCTTTQENTQSADHRFDIIVRADDEGHLNENAFAAHHLDIFKVTFVNGVERDCYIYELYNQNLNIVDCETLLGISNVTDGEITIDYESHTAEALAYDSNSLVESNLQYEYFQYCKLESWELKYCLDNDKNRFVWADNGLYPVYISYPDVLDGEHLEFQGIKTVFGSDELIYGTAEQASRYWEDNAYGWSLRNVGGNDSLVGTRREDWEILMEDYELGIILILEDMYEESLAVTNNNLSQESINLGKGVIYYMKDEWNNECPYDFKNILFERCKITECPQSPGLIGLYAQDGANGITVDDEQKFMVPTFCMIDLRNETVHDVSVEQNVYISDENVYYKTKNNHISDYIDVFNGDNEQNYQVMILPDVVFVTDTGICSINGNYGEFYAFYNNNFGKNCINNTFGNGSYNNIFSNFYQENSFGNSCNNNSFGSGCRFNLFGNDFNGCSFGDNCTNNSFGDYCSHNTFGSRCYNNTFESYCQYNSFGNGCYNNSFKEFKNSSFENFCYNITFGYGCDNNTFGNSCSNISFGDYCQNTTVSDSIQYCIITGGSQNAPVKNAQILNGTSGSNNNNKLTITFAANKNYIQIAGKNTSGILKIWNPADLV